MSLSRETQEIEFDQRFKTPFSCRVVGPSGCDKSFLVKSVNHVMDVVPEIIVWIYTSFQSMYAQLQKIYKKY